MSASYVSHIAKIKMVTTSRILNRGKIMTTGTPEQVKVDAWKAEAALRFIKQCHVSLDDGISFAHASYENINGDIEHESPQDCVDAEIDAMRSC